MEISRRGRISEEALLRSKWITGNYWDRHGVPQKQRPVLEKRRAARVERLEARLLVFEGSAPWLTVRDAISDLPDPEIFPGNGIPDHRHNPGARTYKGHTGSRWTIPPRRLRRAITACRAARTCSLAPTARCAISQCGRRRACRRSRTTTFSEELGPRQCDSSAMPFPVLLAEVVARSVANSVRAHVTQ